LAIDMRVTLEAPTKTLTIPEGSAYLKLI